jgi:hypothetical protein
MPYQRQIFGCDEDFFLQFESNLPQSDLTSDNLLAGMKIKNMWQSPETTERQKAYIWMYFQKLVLAGQKVGQ